METEQVKNYGLDLTKEKADREDTDYEHTLGGIIEYCIAEMQSEDRSKYLPVGEVQRGVEDTMDCASRAPVNMLETKFNYLLKNGLLNLQNELWLRESGYVVDNEVQFSDAFIAIKSGTTRSGNSLKAPCQAIHEHGLVPKLLVPLEKTMTWSEYHDPSRITTEIENLGREFARRFPVNYKRFYSDAFAEILAVDMIVVGGYAWPRPDNDGVYPSVDMEPNHAFLDVRLPEHIIFDNYIDPYDGDFVKSLAPDYKLLSYGYRLYITQEVVDESDVVVHDPIYPYWDWLVGLFKRLFNYKYV